MERYLFGAAVNKADRLEFAFSFELQVSFSSVNHRAPLAVRFKRDSRKMHQHDRQEIWLLEEDEMRMQRKMKGARVVRGAAVDCLCRTIGFLGKGRQYLCQAAATLHP